MKEKWIKEVWEFVAKDPMINDFRNSRYDFKYLWVAPKIQRILEKKPDITGLVKRSASDKDYQVFVDEFKAALIKYGIPASDYSLEKLDSANLITTRDGGQYVSNGESIWFEYGTFSSPDVYVFRYAGREVLFNNLFFSSCFEGLEFPCLSLCILPKGINVKALLDLMKDGLNHIIEEYEFKRDYYINFCKHFIEADDEVKISSLRSENFNYPEMVEIAELSIRLEAFAKSKEFPNSESFAGPTAMTYDPVRAFVNPLEDILNKIKKPEDKFEIVVDPEKKAHAIVKLNGNVAYVKCNSSDFLPISVFFEPEHMICSTGTCTYYKEWNYLACYIYYGLKKCDELKELYDEFSRLMKIIPGYMELQVMDNKKHPQIHFGPICKEGEFPKEPRFFSDSFASDEVLREQVLQDLKQKGYQVEFDSSWKEFRFDIFKSSFNAIWVELFDKDEIVSRIEKMYEVYKRRNSELGS